MEEDGGKEEVDETEANMHKYTMRKQSDDTEPWA